MINRKCRDDPSHRERMGGGGGGCVRGEVTQTIELIN